MRGIFEEVPEDDAALNALIEVHVSCNSPMVKQGMYTRTRAQCEFCGDKHAMREEYCDLKLDEVEVNESVETASATTIGDLIGKMKYERRLVFAVILKSTGNNINFHELRASYRRTDDEKEDDGKEK